jgi:hypothetical protein
MAARTRARTSPRREALLSQDDPLDPRELFSGVWKGEGELRPRGPARLLLRRGRVSLVGRGEWLSEHSWQVREQFQSDAGFALERHMVLEQLAPGLARAQASDMPRGALLEIGASGFRFRRFASRVRYLGLRLPLGCASEARLAEDGLLHARIRLDFLRLPVAELTLRIERRSPAP